MRFLANENFPLNAVEALRQQEHDVVWIRTESPGISDFVIPERVVLTCGSNGSITLHWCGQNRSYQ